MRSGRRAAALGLTVLAALLSVGASPGTGASRGPATNQTWTEALATVSRGRFHEGLRAIEGLVESGQANESVKEVHRWLASFDALEQQRRELSRADYDKYVGWVKERCAKGNWSKAVDNLFRAYLSCDDPDTFRKEPWVVETVQRAMDHAADLRAKGEWIEAVRIYGALAEIYEPKNEPYRQLREQCRTHILLEETYKPEGEWKEVVRDIEPEMARAALRLVAERYVTEPDMRKVVLGGLQRLVLLAATEKLARTFPSLGDSDAVEEFTRRIETNIRMAKEPKSLTAEDAVRLFDRAIVINDETVRIPQEVLVCEFTEGCLEPLDEFSSMIWPAEVEQFRKDTMGEFSGVGIQISLENRVLKVISPLEDTPAYEAGIQPGDIITKVDGESTKGITIDQAVRRITGPAGTRVVLTIQRVGREKEFDVPLVRARIKVRGVKGLSRDGEGHWNYWADAERKIAYVRVTGFMEGTVEELRDVLEGLQRRSMRGLILDLRFNPGGLLNSAVDMCDLFLPPEQRIVSTKGRDSKEWEVSSSNDKNIADIPMVLLINDYSASASEIVAGALQDHHRCLIVGERTFGKGSVQNLLPLGAGSSFIKLTTAKYYLPDGRCIQKVPGEAEWGVDPDVQIKLVPKEMTKVLDLRRKQDVLKGKDQKDVPAVGRTEAPGNEVEEEVKDVPESAATRKADEEADPKDENNRPEIDPQYEAALLLMRVRLVSNEPWPFEKEAVTARAARRGSI